MWWEGLEGGKARTGSAPKRQDRWWKPGWERGQQESEARDRLERSPEGNSVKPGDGLDKKVRE